MLDFTWEPYGDGYIITYKDGGCHPASRAEVALVREVERLRKAAAKALDQAEYDLVDNAIGTLRAVVRA